MESLIYYPHAESIVLNLKVRKINVKRVIVNTSSNTFLITINNVRQLKYDTHHSEPERPLMRFRGSQVTLWELLSYHFD